MSPDNRSTQLGAAALQTDTASATTTSTAGGLSEKVEAFRKAQFDCNPQDLDALCMSELSYSHSNGHVEDKATFVTNSSDGRYVFNHLEYNNRTERVVGSTAVVRFEWRARQSWKDGKVTDTHMGILMIWVRLGDAWKLLARSATKLV